jgi:hypothetical protein
MIKQATTLPGAVDLLDSCRVVMSAVLANRRVLINTLTAGSDQFLNEPFLTLESVGPLEGGVACGTGLW